MRDAATPEEFTKRIAAYAATLEPGEWILNGTWDHELWGGELPRRDWIDAVTPDNPVWVNRLDGHMALGNSLALELAGIDADTPDVEGGEIVRDSSSGRPTGILKDNAMSLVDRAIPERSNALLDRAMTAAMAYVASNGVTSVHDMDGWHSLDGYRRAKAKGGLITRIYAIAPLPEWQRLHADVGANGRGDSWLRIGGLKGFMDGSLGSHTAAFLEPLTDAPDDRGFRAAYPSGRRCTLRHAKRHCQYAAVSRDRRWPLGRQSDRYGTRATDDFTDYVLVCCAAIQRSIFASSILSGNDPSPITAV